MLIKRVYEIDPLICHRCSGQTKIVAFMEPPQGDVIEKILRGHRRAAMVGGLRCPASPRAPPAKDLRVHDADSDWDSDSASQEPRGLTFVDEPPFGPPSNSFFPTPIGPWTMRAELGIYL
jgi:hypothetical protein